MAVTLNMTASEFVDLVTRAADASLGEEGRREAEAGREKGWAAFSVWEGYDPAKTYQPLNKVLYEGSTYVCLRESTGKAPSWDNADWLLVAVKGEQGARGEPGPSYTLPVASQEALGGVRPVAKTAEMTQAVGVDADGMLWALPGGNDYAEGEGIAIENGSLSVRVSPAEGNTLQVVDGALYVAPSPSLLPTLKVETDPPTAALTVIAQNGNKTVASTTDETGQAVFDIDTFGVWTVSTVADSEPIAVQVDIPKEYIAGLKFSQVSRTLDKNSWDIIRAVSDAGDAPNYWSVGDTKTIVIDGKVGATKFSNVSIDVFILGFDHNAIREGLNKIHFQVGKINGVNVALIDEKYGNTGTPTYTNYYFTMNATKTNSGGWKSCQMRTVILGNDGTPTAPVANTLLAALPSELRAVIKPCPKYSGTTATTSASTTDYLFLLSCYELTGAPGANSGNEKEYQSRYDYYKTNPSVTYKYNNTSTTIVFWTRTASFSTNSVFYSTAGGSLSALGADLSRGVVCGFCV